MLRKPAVPHHSGYIQILDGYGIRLAVADDAFRHLMDCILPDVGDLLMKHRHLMFEFLPVVGALALL